MDLLDVTVPETITRSPLIKQIMLTESPKWLPGQPFSSSQLGVNWVLTWVFRRKLANFRGVGDGGGGGGRTQDMLRH